MLLNAAVITAYCCILLLAGVPPPLLAEVPALLAGVPALLAGVPTLLAGVPTLLAGVPTLLAGVPALLAGVPTLLLLAGLPTLVVLAVMLSKWWLSSSILFCSLWYAGEINQRESVRHRPGGSFSQSFSPKASRGYQLTGRCHDDICVRMRV